MKAIDVFSLDRGPAFRKLFTIQEQVLLQNLFFQEQRAKVRIYLVHDESHKQQAFAKSIMPKWFLKKGYFPSFLTQVASYPGYAGLVGYTIMWVAGNVKHMLKAYCFKKLKHSYSLSKYIWTQMVNPKPWLQLSWNRISSWDHRQYNTLS